MNEPYTKNEQLLGHLLNALEPDEAERIEQRLDADAALCEGYVRMQVELKPILELRDEIVRQRRSEITPPVGLTERTMAFIHQHVHEIPIQEKNAFYASVGQTSLHAAVELSTDLQEQTWTHEDFFCDPAFRETDTDNKMNTEEDISLKDTSAIKSYFGNTHTNKIKPDPDND